MPKATKIGPARGTARGYRSPPWRIPPEMVDRVATIAADLPVSASEIARQALAVGLDGIERVIGAARGDALAKAVALAEHASARRSRPHRRV